AAAVVSQDRRDRGEVAMHDLAQRLRVERLAEARRALEVGEDDRDGLADLLRPDSRRERRAAEPAEPEAVGVLLAAGGTRRHPASLRRSAGVSARRAGTTRVQLRERARLRGLPRRLLRLRGGGG